MAPVCPECGSTRLYRDGRVGRKKCVESRRRAPNREQARKYIKNIGGRGVPIRLQICQPITEQSPSWLRG